MGELLSLVGRTVVLAMVGVAVAFCLIYSALVLIPFSLVAILATGLVGIVLSRLHSEWLWTIANLCRLASLADAAIIKLMTTIIGR